MFFQALCLFLLKWTLAFIYGTLVSIRLLFAVVLSPRKSFANVIRPVPPPVLDDPSLGQHHFITLKDRGIKLHYVSNGPTDAPLMLFVHGFPEVCV